MHTLKHESLDFTENCCSEMTSSGGSLGGFYAKWVLRREII
jgi:hypothetical protein